MSLDFADLIMQLDDEFQLNLHEVDVQKVGDLIPKTVGQLHAFLVRELKRRGPVDSTAVWQKLCRIAGTTFHKNPASIRPEHRFIEDLGMH